MNTLVLEHLARLLEYPDRETVPLAEALLSDLRADPARAAVADALTPFVVEARGMAPAVLEEAYSRSFDLSPVCVPYVSVHLFGEESFHRARLMTALAARWEELGLDLGAELPDHLALVLRGGARLSPDEWRELLRLGVLPALVVMQAQIARAKTPYRHVIDAALISASIDADLTLEAAQKLPLPMQRLKHPMEVAHA